VICAVSALAVMAVVTRFYSPDPYYLNTHDRIADHYPGSRIAMLAVLAAAATVIARIRPRIGAPIAAAVLVLCAATLADEGYNN